MRIQKISGDGNCLFQSCGYLLSRCHCQVRKKVIHYFKYHSKMLINGEPLSWWIQMNGYSSSKEYIDNMKKLNVWGDGLCLSVISLVYHRSIRIYELRVDPTTQKHELIQIVEYFPEFEKSLNLLYSGEHYDALIL